MIVPPSGIVAEPVPPMSSVSGDSRTIFWPLISPRSRFLMQSTTVTGIKKRDLGEINGQNIVLESPETEDMGGTGSATIPDGGTIIFKLAYAPKDKVWVVVLQPTL